MFGENSTAPIGLNHQFYTTHTHSLSLRLPLPLPRVQKTKNVGNTVQHRLVYDNDPTLDVWVPLSEYTDLGDTVSLSCKTEKDKDKRTHR